MPAGCSAWVCVSNLVDLHYDTVSTCPSFCFCHLHGRQACKLGQDKSDVWMMQAEKQTHRYKSLSPAHRRNNQGILVLQLYNGIVLLPGNNYSAGCRPSLYVVGCNPASKQDKSQKTQNLKHLLRFESFDSDGVITCLGRRWYNAPGN